MLSSTISGMRATAATVLKVRPWPACTSRPAAAAASRGALDAAPARAQAGGIVLERALAIGAGVQLDDLRAEARGGLDGRGVRLDEQRHADARAAAAAR